MEKDDVKKTKESKETKKLKKPKKNESSQESSQIEQENLQNLAKKLKKSKALKEAKQSFQESSKKEQENLENPENLAKKSKKSKQTKKLEIAFLLILLLGISAWLAVTFYRAYQPKPQFLQGQIQAREYSVSSKLAGRIENISVKKGDVVKKGDLMYQIHSPEVQAKLTQAQAGYEAAKALSEEANKGSREEAIIAAKDLWSAAKAMADLSEKTYQRIQELYKKGVVSLQRKDEAFAAFQSAKYNENAAYQQYKIALDGVRDESKRAFSEKENVAKGQVSEVEAYIKDINAYAPVSGEVSNVLLHDGELSPSGFPVVLLIDLEDVWLKISVSEQYLSKFKKDSEFEGYVPALKQQVKFKVRYVSVMGDFATWKASNEGYDMKSYEVEAIPTEKIEGFRVGMSVLVKVD